MDRLWGDGQQIIGQEIMICPFCEYEHDNEDDLYGCPNCLGEPPDDWVNRGRIDGGYSGGG